MAKQVEKVEIVIRGTKADGPQEVGVSYRLEDSADSDMKSDYKYKKLSSPDLTKKIDDATVAGEFWFDEIAVIETDEGIS